MGVFQKFLRNNIKIYINFLLLFYLYKADLIVLELCNIEHH